MNTHTESVERVRGNVFAALADITAGRRWVLVTSPGWLARGILERLRNGDAMPGGVMLAPSPLELSALWEPYAEQVEIIVAIGGGSVMDRAKALALQFALRDAPDWLPTWRTTDRLPDRFAAFPQIVAVPSLPGSGAECTPFATVWDGPRKRSLQHPEMRPGLCILDAGLVTTVGRDQRIISALDALAHGVEAIWNRNATPQTDALASDAIRLISTSLRSECSREGADQLLLEASWLAGTAIAQTQTALSHSISYVLTGEFGIPHGLATSLTLPQIGNFVLPRRPDRLGVVSQALGCRPADVPSSLKELLRCAGAPRLTASHLTHGTVERARAPLLDRSRSLNFCCDVTELDARDLTARALAETVITADKGMFGL